MRRALALVLLALAAGIAHAQALTPAQRATLKTVAQADTTAAALMTAADDIGLADWFNANAVPDYWAWKTRLTRAEAVQGTSVDGTTFNWTGAGFIGRSQGERDAWREMWNHEGACNPSLPNVRAAFADIFSGATAPAPANRTHLLTMARRKVSVAERALATGLGTTVSPSIMAWEGPMSYADASLIRVQ